MNVPKNHTISKFAAKAAIRLILIVMATPVLLYFTQSKKEVLGQVSFPNKLALIAPILLLFTFTGLLIAVLKNKYLRIDLNWLFVLCSAFLMLYLVLLYIRIFPAF